MSKFRNILRTYPWLNFGQERICSFLLVVNRKYIYFVNKTFLYIKKSVAQRVCFKDFQLFSS